MSRFDDHWKCIAEPQQAVHFGTSDSCTYSDSTMTSSLDLQGIAVITREYPERVQDEDGWSQVTKRKARFPKRLRHQFRLDGTFTIDAVEYCVESIGLIEGSRIELELHRMDLAERTREGYRE